MMNPEAIGSAGFTNTIGIFFGQRQCGRDVLGVHYNDHIRLQRQKLGRCLVYPLDLIAEQATIDNEIAALYVAEPCKRSFHN